MSDEEANNGVTTGDEKVKKQMIHSKSYLSTRSLMIAVVLTAAIGLGSIGWYLNTSSADIEPESKAEMYNFIKENYATKAQIKEILEYHDELNDWIVAHNKMLSKNFTSIAKTLTNHNNQLIVLKAASQIQLPPTTTGTADYKLRTINTDSQDVSEFAQNQAVLITGEYNGSESKASYEVRKNNAFVQSGSISISGDFFTFAYNVIGDAELGTYTITITIDNKKDSVSFEIE